ncbi:VOC family protein [Devosia sp. BSSL-BM10]|uniref:VOC family protein n=1 Tax=Devosia litorisediminis TaxID=2829817 RepID=A0A942I4T1_9HYPH|nr:VOC family protein [Devosia litorisediminis]MBS3847806.1 VOC family protein [Devosia litorisediminis]
MTDIMTCLWFDNRIDDAIEFYTSTFKSAKILRRVRRDAHTPTAIAEIELEGHRFMLLNGGPQFTFSEAVSFVIGCRDQDEVDYFWDTLTSGGGSPGQCGWCKDRFGLSWQVVPDQLAGTIGGADPAGAQRATEAMFKMTKLIIADLEQAYAGN